MTAREAITKYAGKLTPRQIAERTGLRLSSLYRTAAKMGVRIGMRPARVEAREETAVDRFLRRSA